MIRQLIYVAACLCACSCNQPETEVAKPEVVNFHIKGTKEVVDSVYKNGTHHVSTFYDQKTNEKVAYVKFHDNGQPYTDIRYKSGLKNGESYSYREDGSLWSLNTYKNDTLHGAYKTWHENGQLMMQGQFTDGLQEGEWFFYYPDGKLDTRGFFIHGAKSGIWTTYNREGRLMREVAYSKK